MPRTFVIGDPQGPFAKVLDVLDWHGALAGDRLAPDVTLVSIGDHFDYDHGDPVTAGQQGLQLLRWLASHDPAQVVLLLGNHDAARVMELAAISDAEFAAARAQAADPAAYRAAFPALPAPGVVARDYASFSSEQRTLVRELLVAQRFQLACAARLPDGRAVLVTHAGITTRELGLLGVHDVPDPRALAALLNAYLTDAVDRVRTAWARGHDAALSLEPLHVAGGDGEEGGGLLYHRPSNPEVGSKLDPARPRRFDPRTLPGGLTQVAGHSGHAKCTYELGAWASEQARARKHGGIRTLRVAAGEVFYDLGIAPPADAVADLILVDGELRRVPAAEVLLLPLAGLDR